MKLTPFSDDDTKKFIRLIIERIPDIALDRIWRMSNNNPLFIIHFINRLFQHYSQFCHIEQLLSEYLYQAETLIHLMYHLFTENDKSVGTWKLTPFSDDDTKKFIRLIIERIPDIALDRMFCHIEQLLSEYLYQAETLIHLMYHLQYYGNRLLK